MIQRTESKFLSPNASNNEMSDMNVDGSRKQRKTRRSRGGQRRQRRRLLMEGLESRKLLAAVSSLGSSNAPVDTDLFLPSDPRNIGTVPAFVVNEAETANETGVNDSRFSAQFLPLGTGPGEEDTIDINGSMPVTISSQGNVNADIDTYAFNLRAGDILDVSVIGAGANLTVLYGPSESGTTYNPRATNGAFWFGTDSNQGLIHPDPSPLMTTGNAVAAQVVPHTGTYYLIVAPSTTSVNYTAGLRVYRPIAESLPIGAQQTIYLDFEGGFYPSTMFPGSTNPFGIIRFSSLRENLAALGLQDTSEAAYNELIDKTIDLVHSDFYSVITGGQNGDYNNTGNPGEFAIRILNSRDAALGYYPEPALDDPLVTRLFIGGTIADAGIADILGVAQSLDIGNFDMNENSILPIDFFLAAATQFPIANNKSVLDAVARSMAWTVSHEAGHTFGLRHTDGTNAVGSIIDGVGNRRDEFGMGVGFDGIFGTIDDTVPEFSIDRFDLNEGLFGFQDTANALAYSLSTGTVGSGISGRVFSDVNRDGSGTGDPGLPGVTVFADTIQNGILDPNEPVAVTNANGLYTLNVASGTAFSVVAMTPAQYAPTLPTQRFATGGDSGVDFGFTKVISDITGTKFADTNGNGVFDSTESGIEGVYIYLDLDGDDSPDIGEPSARTDANGRYSIDFPGPGTYAIREVIGPGYVQTFPTSGEHIVNFNGVALTDNYNFGNLPSRDYGDAPDTYQTTVAAGGPSHGISTALGLGASVDRESDGIPTASALGDDLNNIDDEDGVVLLTPLGPGGTANLAVTARNTTGSPAYLQGWIDFNANGVFDASEKVFTDLELGAGTSTLSVNVPASAVVGSTYARFRYSPTAGLGVGGEADSGEVEDYQFDILQQAAVANDDTFTVSRNSLSNRLDVLANDFETSITQLRIISLNSTGSQGTQGVVSIIENGRALSYTPPNGFTGRDVFQYVVVDQTDTQYTATVVVNVNFQSNVPIAVDDTFDIPQGSSNRALNVLDNDVPSIFGGISITSVTAGDQGGQITLEGGGQTIRYTPQPGFVGTEQFIYSIEDANGSISTAQVTVNSQPGAMIDDMVDFTIGIYDVVNNQPISSVQVGQPFFVRVFVEELNNPNFSPEGVASAFLDLLYTDELVATRDTITTDEFGFDITFGENFQGGGFKLGDAITPGLINDVGAVQPIPGDGNLITHADPAELFTLTMTGISPGVALFAADPADSPVAETILVGEDVALTPAQQRLGRTELTIFPASDNFASAIDDAFVDGFDSVGNPIQQGVLPNTLDVLDNDIFGPTGTIQEFGIVTAPSLGTAQINNNGTPLDPSDDTIDYSAFVDANGFDSFTYVIVSGDGVRSVAEVTMAIGDADSDDIVEISFGLVDEFGNSITSVASGQTFGVQVFVKDLRSEFEGREFVFAAYLDMLYDTGIINPAPAAGGGRYDFRVAFDADFDATAGVGTAVRRGIIDEFGSLLQQTVAEGGGVSEPNLMATVFFTAGTVFEDTVTQVIGSPADASPFQDTLLFDRDDPVEVSQILYNSLNVTVRAASALQNPAMAEDVNNDGFVTPSDALTIINALAREGEGEIQSLGMYTDVNGDMKTTALDALTVINHLALLAAQSFETESVVSDQLASNAPAGDEVTRDEAFADLSQQTKVVSVGDSSKSLLASQPVALTFADADDKDDDLLALLADDQSELA
ncbi:Serine-aspartate repeat-containing protein D precursor [Stieleria neptunia]|uniref:Serine-aspartate repeat-containing protein D n=1 Tax=Stieleria neptunia TaxID=2527979 RepID=A0A518HR71_9BACT|nr:Ig-like domain-containing protein [Stieleria neptunia]QDV43291.1 Serine-aspartate repeat-containing protein D precursor [Stieleria neptunia]